jgi:hypothetical protein
MARPSSFSETIADAICERLALGESLRSICDDAEMPGLSTVFRWLAANPEFRDQYTRAREAQADTIFDEILDIADDGRNDWMLRAGAEEDCPAWVQNGEAMRRSQLRIDARKWMAGKLRPKVYGDKQSLELSGTIDVASELSARLAAARGRKSV